MISYRRRYVYIFVLACVCFVLCSPSVAATRKSTTKLPKQAELWKEISKDSIKVRTRRMVQPEREIVYRLNRERLQEVFAAAPVEFTEAARAQTVVLELPAPNGKMLRFRIEESSVLAPHIAKDFPGWKSFQGYGIDDPAMTARFDWNINGFHAQVLAGDETYLIDPYALGDTENYTVYFKRDLMPSGKPFRCDFGEDAPEESSAEPSYHSFAPTFAHGAQIRTYRLAIAVTAEYTAVFGGQAQAFGQVTTSVNRLDGIYRNDFAVSFQLVSGTNLIYTNAATDPYTNSITSAQLNANQTNIDNVIGSANYDVGHLYATSNNGLAALRSFCGASKARGASGQPNPTGDGFVVDYVAHEIGHQIGGNHTFNSDNNCGEGNLGTRVEPGSGVTIMSYAGICDSTANPQRNAIPFFHVASQTEGISFITTGAGNTCGTLSGANNVPVIAALANYTLPINTPFALTASATDADNDALTYSWEQNDGNTAQSFYPTVTDDDDTTLTPRQAFRSYAAVASGTRNFPSLPYILNGTNEPPVTYTGTSLTGSVCANGVTCITGEDLPSAARTMNFRVSVRDGRGGTADAGTVLTFVTSAAPFQVTTQNARSPLAPEVTWQGNSTQTVTWNNANTNVAPYNVANVRILLSTNGGQTFPTVLAASTPNDGSQAVTIPNTPTTTARIKVEAVGNIFFDINNANFAITAAPTAGTATIAGRVVNASGAGVRRATVTIYDPTSNETRTATTNSFGYFSVPNLTVGTTYVMNVRAKGLVFSNNTQVFSLTGDLTDVLFVGNPQ